MRTITDFDTIDISLDELDQVHGGLSAAQWSSIKQQAGSYCPQTVQKYGNMNPAKINKSVATRIGNACVAEMPGWEQGMARGQIGSMIDQAFPKK